MNYESKKDYIATKICKYYKDKYNKIFINSNLRNKRINERRIGGFHKVYSNITARIYKSFKDNNIKFNMSYENIIGCTFNLNSEDGILNCFNYKNLQPLWQLENRQKYNKIIL